MNIKDLTHKLIHNDNILFSFLRSGVAGFVTTVTDLGLRILFYSVILMAVPEFYRSNISVAIGAVTGGIINCIINYRFTFHATGQNITLVAIKFVLVRIICILLNMYGTTLIAEYLYQWPFLADKGVTNDDIFAATTFAVAMTVNIFWNFLMQRYFVFRSNRLDSYIVSLFACLFRKGRRKS